MSWASRAGLQPRSLNTSSSVARRSCLRLMAVAACLWPYIVVLPVAAAQPLSLDDAFARVMEKHPDLLIYHARSEELTAERALAEQRPAWTAGVELENALGSGEVKGFDQSEFTLGLASVLERGGKLDARRTLAQSRIDALAVGRETTRLDLLAETARRYLMVVVADLSQALAAADVDQRQRTVDAARTRLQAGASPESVLLTAQAALALAELARARAEQQRSAAAQHLAALWGARAPAFEVAGSPLALPSILPLENLTSLLERAPELAQFADERRIREARLQLARSSASSDLQWQVGVRHLSETNDVALVGGLSLTLGARARARPQIQASQAALASLEIEREASGMALYSTLVEAHGRYTVAQAEVDRLGRDVLPRLGQAEQAAERAFRGGATSYLEWAQLQSELTDIRQQQLDAALEAQRALIEIQRLTGQPFVLAAAAQGGTP